MKRTLELRRLRLSDDPNIRAEFRHRTTQKTFLRENVFKRSRIGDWQMGIALLLATFAIGLPFLISFYATRARVGLAVSERFLERMDSIPAFVETDAKPITATTVREWARDNQASASQYAQRVIPLDLIYLFVLGAFAWLASRSLAQSIAWPKSFSALGELYWILPAIYTVSDLCEDILIAVLLTFNSLITNASVLALKVCKTAKMIGLSLSLLQLALLSLLSVA